MKYLAVVTIIGLNQHNRRFTTTDMQYFKMVYDLPSGDSDFLFWFGMQNIKDEDATSASSASTSVVAHPMNRLAPIISRRQLFQEQPRTFLSSHILQMSHAKKIESVAISVKAGCDKSR